MRRRNKDGRNEWTLWQKIIAKTPRKNKVRGQLMTAIGTTAGIVLASGVVTAPLGILALTITAVLTGGMAFNDATKTIEDVKDNK